MKHDWQSYRDGSMEPRAAAELTDLMRTDRSVAAEYAAFCEVASLTRASGREVSVPLKELERNWRSQFVPARSRARKKSAILLVACGAFAYGAWFLTLDPNRISSSTATAELATADPATAASWVNSHVTFTAPPMDLAKTATLVSARYGEGWAEYDYRAGGEAYSITLCYGCRPNFLDTKDVISTQDGPMVYRCKGSGWQQLGYAFYVEGPRESVRLQMISEAFKILKQWKRQSMIYAPKSVKKSDCQ
ncbi:MAG: hypothetical protein K8R88_10075 [Armatimonadetes bacterium]|nr:hypothetical protein [Armatimonadota bacterium]